MLHLRSGLLSGAVLTGEASASHVAFLPFNVFEGPVAPHRIVVADDNKRRVVPVVIVEVFQSAICLQDTSTVSKSGGGGVVRTYMPLGRRGR